MGEGKSRGMGRRTKWIVSFASMVVAGVGLAAGCALDDSAITSVGPGGGGDASVFDGAGPGGDAAADTGPACVPKTCANYPSDCHSSLDDGCGKKIDCSSACPGGQDCIADGGFCNGPPVCMDAGAPQGNCGTLTNPGTGQQTNCGSCSDTNDTCTANTCVCGGVTCGGACCPGGQVCDTTATSCCSRESVATACGNKCNTTAQDNCHMTDTCSSTCTNPAQCAPNTHTCDNPPTCPNMGQPGGSCGTITGSDGLSTNCGSCSNAFSCTGNVCKCGSATSCSAGDVCFSNSCCHPDSASTTCNGTGSGSYCGNPVVNNCGQNVDCGTCSDNQVCQAAGGCNCQSTNGTNNSCAKGATCHTSGNGSCT